jgi:hypothetical protein
MDFSRRWFLKSAAMAVVATQLPLIEEKGHRVLFFDGGSLLVKDYAEKGGIIRAKVVNGAWDLVADTRKRTMEAWSNPAYGIDSTAELKTTTSYNRLIEIRVDESIGEVTEDLKPCTVMVQKFKEVQQEKLVWEQNKCGMWHPKRVNGKRVYETVTTLEPCMIEREQTWDNSKEKYWVEESWDGPGHWQEGGVLTMTYWEPEMEPHVVDPLMGAGCDYNAIIQAAERKRTWGI